MGERPFRVQPQHFSGHGARLVAASTFEAAAIAWSEGEGAAAQGDGEIVLKVRDMGSGLEHCIRLDLGSGDTAPCD